MKKLVSVFTAILVIGLFACLALGSGEDEAVVSPGDASGETSAQSSDTLTANPGDTLTTEYLTITYTGCKDYTDYNQYAAPKEGNKIIQLEFSVENTGSTDRYISSLDFDCYADNEAASSYVYGEDLLSSTISAGRKASGCVYFEVPKDAEKIEVEYETSYWSGKKAIFVVQ